MTDPAGRRLRSPRVRPRRPGSYLLTVEGSEAKDLLDDVAHVDRVAEAPRSTIRAQCARGSSGSSSACRRFPSGLDVTIVDGAPHGPGAVRHRRLAEPGLGDIAEAFRLSQVALLTLLSSARAIDSHRSTVVRRCTLASQRKRETVSTVTVEHECLATPDPAGNRAGKSQGLTWKCKHTSHPDL